MRGPIAQKIIDFVVCERATLRPVAIIEFDDRTHDPRKDANRDEMLMSAEYRVLRCDSRAKPTTADIAASLAEITTARFDRS